MLYKRTANEYRQCIRLLSPAGNKAAESTISAAEQGQFHRVIAFQSGGVTSGP